MLLLILNNNNNNNKDIYNALNSPKLQILTYTHEFIVDLTTRGWNKINTILNNTIK